MSVHRKESLKSMLAKHVDPKLYLWPIDNDSNLLEYLRDFHHAFHKGYGIDEVRDKPLHFRTSVVDTDPFTVRIHGDYYYENLPGPRFAAQYFTRTAVGVYVMDFEVNVKNDSHGIPRLHLKGNYQLSVAGSWYGHDEQLNDLFDCQGFRDFLSQCSSLCNVLSIRNYEERRKLYNGWKKMIPI